MTQWRALNECKYPSRWDRRVGDIYGTLIYSPLYSVLLCEPLGKFKFAQILCLITRKFSESASLKTCYFYYRSWLGVVVSWYDTPSVSLSPGLWPSHGTNAIVWNFVIFFIKRGGVYVGEKSTKEIMDGSWKSINGSAQKAPFSAYWAGGWHTSFHARLLKY